MQALTQTNLLNVLKDQHMFTSANKANKDTHAADSNFCGDKLQAHVEGPRVCDEMLSGSGPGCFLHQVSAYTLIRSARLLNCTGLICDVQSLLLLFVANTQKVHSQPLTCSTARTSSVATFRP